MNPVASRPAGIHLNPLRWWWFYPTWPTLWLLALAGALWFSAHFSWRGLILLVPIVAANVAYRLLLRRHFAVGDTNPGVIVSGQPRLMAVATNMTKDDGEYWAVKIVPCPPRRVMGRKV